VDVNYLSVESNVGMLSFEAEELSNAIRHGSGRAVADGLGASDLPTSSAVSPTAGWKICSQTKQKVIKSR
jgi:hypothetical protein